MGVVYQLKGVSKKYGNHLVLDKINLSVEDGEMLSITGKSGSGKTTLLNILGLLENPSDGIIELLGQRKIKANSRKALKMLRTKIGYLFQNYALIDNETIDYNLEIPLIYSNKSLSEKRNLKTDALMQVGLDLSLKQKIFELSGGEQQRISVARLLLKPCDLILADEPTASLDSSNRDEIIKILKKMNNGGKTIIIVTHDAYVSAQCSRQFNLS